MGVSAVLALVPVLAVGVGTALSHQSAEDPFPHADHQGLFPTCVGCHAGIETGDTSAIYSVRREDCEACHDGDRADRVDWSPPERVPDNLNFTHRGHRDSVLAEGEEALTCGDCHLRPGAQAGGGKTPGERTRMDVGAADPASCLGCHAHRAPDHLDAGVDCARCHDPLSQASRLSVETIASFPRPATHDIDGFVLAHDPIPGGFEAASCAVCHSRESCVRCHLNADALPEIQALASDLRVGRALAGAAGNWPAPEDHSAAGYVYTHAKQASISVAKCANCHTAASCVACHGEVDRDIVSQLPTGRPDGPRGARLDGVQPPGHAPEFGRRHGAAAGAGLPNCASCHLQTECDACHESSAAARPPSRPRPASAAYPDPKPPPLPFDAHPDGPAPGYHPVDFVVRHGAEAFAERTECVECHSNEVFCRSCHERIGIVQAGKQGNGAFHDAQPLWILSHGRAARQNLETCASCHRQTSCLRCHSAKSGLRVNPHGPEFDPERVSRRSTIPCGICHTAGQVGVP